jgi:hypothetical protein
MHSEAMSAVEPYEPILICSGVVAAPVEAVRLTVLCELEKTIGRSSISSDLQRIVWQEFFEDDGLFYDGKRFQIALFSTGKNCTVYVCNLADGWISLYENMVRSGRFDAYFFRATFAESFRYKVFEMAVWRHGLLERQLRALQDDAGWEFLNRGEPLPFEKVERYRKRQVSGRLDRELIAAYSEAAGYNLASITKFHEQCWKFWRNE